MVAMSLEILQRNLRTEELLAQTQEQARQLEEQTDELTHPSRSCASRRSWQQSCGQGEGRERHGDEVHVPRQHEPRDPHADERHHRPLAPRPQDRRSTPSSATTSARSTTPAPRSSSIINDILDFSKIEAGKLDIETTDFQIDDVISSVTTLTAQKAHDKGLEFLADVALRDPAASARRPAPPRPDAHQPRQQRRQVHRARRDPAEDRAARADRREGAAQVLRARHRHRHDAGADRRSCSSRSPRPTCPPPASTAAPGSA